ncbi:hypothetical protein psal_cds_208 [Pandoravirus salinus]|uniref:Uncharacterized protein n=1 Tax=Pandoravirus salinus TaxID=1349410 RepID=S4VWC1_9VIRU|nr:hypothetical protein psal_cds_208 [Pandoravirus salinus]AGO83731.2 hypothetical protein psal_cds_208 [Pandoravirus salinus]
MTPAPKTKTAAHTRPSVCVGSTARSNTNNDSNSSNDDDTDPFFLFTDREAMSAVEVSEPVALVNAPAIETESPLRRWMWLWVTALVLFVGALIALVVVYFVRADRARRQRDAFLAVRATQAVIPDGDYLVRLGDTALYMGVDESPAPSAVAPVTTVGRPVVLVSESAARPWRYRAPVGVASVAGGRALSYVSGDGSLLALGTGAALTLPAPLTASADAPAFGDWIVSRGPTAGTASQPAVIHNTALSGCALPTLTPGAGVPLAIQAGCPPTARTWYFVPVS